MAGLGAAASPVAQLLPGTRCRARSKAFDTKSARTKRVSYQVRAAPERYPLGTGSKTGAGGMNHPDAVGPRDRSCALPIPTLLPVFLRLWHGRDVVRSRCASEIAHAEPAVRQLTVQCRNMAAIRGEMSHSFCLRDAAVGAFHAINPITGPDIVGRARYFNLHFARRVRVERFFRARKKARLIASPFFPDAHIDGVGRMPPNHSSAAVSEFRAHGRRSPVGFG